MEFFPLLNQITTVSETVSKECECYHKLLGPQTQIQAFLVAQTVKNPPAMRKRWVRSLGWKDALEQGMAPTPVFLAGVSSWTEEPGGYSVWGHKESGRTERLSTAQHSPDPKSDSEVKQTFLFVVIASLVSQVNQGLEINFQI